MIMPYNLNKLIYKYLIIFEKKPFVKLKINRNVKNYKKEIFYFLIFITKIK